jgi:hypothetical protein
MIQRIQTIYLAISAFAAAALLFVPVITFNVISGTSTQYMEINTLGRYIIENGIHTQVEAYPYASSLAFIVLLVSVVNIFSFKHRVRQMQLCWVGSLLALALAVMMITKAEPESYGQILNWDVKIGSFLYSAIIIVQMLALRAIRKDELMVRSADRLR